MTGEENCTHNHVPASKPRRENPFLMGTFVLAVLYTIYFARVFLVPLTFALILSILLHPLIEKLKRLKIPEVIGAGILVLSLLLIAGIGSYQLSGPAAKWLDRGPYLLEKVKFNLREIRQVIAQARSAMKNLDEITNPGNKNQTVVAAKKSSLAEQIFAHFQSFSSTVLIILVLLYFMLAYGGRILRRLSSGSLAFVSQMQDEISSYMLTITLINFCLGLLTALMLLGFGFPNPFFWGAVAGFLNFVPYAGAATSLALLTLISILAFNTWTHVLGPPLTFLLLTTLEGQFVTPSILGKRLTVNPLMVLIFILFWGWVWGIFGALMGVPLLVVFMVAARKIPPLQPIGRLLS